MAVVVVKRWAKYTLVGVAGLFVLGGIAYAVDPPAPAPAVATGSPAPTQPPTQPPPTQAPAGAPAAPVAPAPEPAPAAPAAEHDREQCRVTGMNGGVFYITIASAAAHDFSACEGAEQMTPNIDSLLDNPGMDRRCLTETSQDVELYNALIGVYSDTKKANLAAAKDWCDSAGFGNE
jgi:hypothetical protein